jgi:tetratricopeptide (TPR) repeat protein
MAAMKKRTIITAAPVPVQPPASAVRLLVLAAAVLLLVPVALERNRVYRDTVSVWESMVRSSPNKRRPHQNYGQALSTAGRFEEALNQFKIVLDLPDDGSVPMRDTYREIGVVYFRLGLYDESINSWKKGLEHAPFDSGLMNNLAIALMKLKRIDEAASYAETAVRQNEFMAEPMNTLGEIYLAKGDPGKAAHYFQRYLVLRPEDSRGYWNTALALKDAGDYRGSLKYVQEFLARESDQRYRQVALQLLEFLKTKVK